MEEGWWRKAKNKKKKNILKKEGKNYGIWRIWWTICTTRIKK